MKKQLMRYARQVISMFLAIVIFLNVPLYAYADVHTSSNAMYDDVSEGEYMPDNILSRYEKSFEYCPLTPQEVLNPRSRIAIADDVVVFVLCCIAAACGLLLPKVASTVSDFFTPFDAWLRRTSGNVAAVMTAWNSVLNGKLGEKITGLKLIIPKFQEYMRSNVTGFGTGSTEISFNVGSGVLKDGPYALPVISESQLENYIFSFVAPYNSSEMIDIFNGSGRRVATVAALSISSTKRLNIHGFNSQDVYSYYSDNRSFAWRTTMGDGNYKYSDGIFAPVSGLAYYFGSSYSFDDVVQYIANCSPYPVFLDTDYARSYVKYGTLDGLVSPDPDFTITTQKAWSDLQQDFMNKYAYADVLTIPETQAEFEALYDALTKSVTGADVITTLKPVWDITENTGGGDIVVVPSVAYSSLCYIISAIASYCGTSLTDEQKNTFISSFYTSNIDGTSALVEEQAQEIIRNFVVINGGSQKPDDNNDNNKYKILKKLAVSVGAFLVSVGLVSDIPDFENEPSVSNNVQVVEKQDSGGSTSPDANIDLSGILNYLKQFLTILNNWSNPLALMDSLIFKLGLSSLIDGIKTAINNVPKLISGELSLPELFGNVTDAIFSMPQQVADAIAKALGLEKAFDNLGLSELFDNIIELLPDELVEGFALPDLFSSLGTIVGSIPLEISKIFGLVNGFSLNDWLNNILQSIQNLPSAFAEKFPSSGGSDSSGKDDGGDSGFRKFINALILLALILVVLLIFFLNCLRFIVLLFQIPASAELFNEDILAGMNFLKTTMLPVFNVSLYSLLMGAVYFVVFMSIIGAIRKKINHLRIPAN